MQTDTLAPKQRLARPRLNVRNERVNLAPKELCERTRRDRKLRNPNEHRDFGAKIITRPNEFGGTPGQVEDPCGSTVEDAFSAEQIKARSESSQINDAKERSSNDAETKHFLRPFVKKQTNESTY